MKNQTKERIKHLKNLLEVRRKEYEIFGVTAADMEKDREIINEIKKLRKNL